MIYLLEISFISLNLRVFRGQTHLTLLYQFRLPSICISLFVIINNRQVLVVGVHLLILELVS
jgi:hypothetical protein